MVFKTIEAIGKKYNFDLTTPIKEIKKEGMNAILYGMQENFSVKLKSAGISKEYKIQFDGIINFIEDQSKLSYVKSIARWANKYMSEYHCESCGGSRLNKESTSYKVGEKNIKELSTMDISHFYSWVTSVKKRLKRTTK